jgi:hypothetical protein
MVASEWLSTTGSGVCLDKEVAPAVQGWVSIHTFGDLSTEVGNVTSERSGVTRCRFSHVIKVVTIKHDNVSYEPRVLTVRSDNRSNKPRAITMKSDNFSPQCWSVMR